MISVQEEQQVLSGLTVTQTFATILILIFSSLLLSRDTLVLVVHPVERMLALIRRLTSSLSAYSDSSYNQEGERRYQDIST